MSSKDNFLSGLELCGEIYRERKSETDTETQRDRVSGKYKNKHT